MFMHTCLLQYKQYILTQAQAAKYMARHMRCAGPMSTTSGFVRCQRKGLKKPFVSPTVVKETLSS